MTQSAAGFGEKDLRMLGQRLRHLREQRQWSLKRLADESTVSVAAIRKIELGLSNPSLLTILSLSEALGEPIDRLISAARDGEARVVLTRGAAAQGDRTRDLVEPAMRCSVVELKSGRSTPDTKADLKMDGSAFGFVLDGAVEISGTEEDDSGACRTGDAFHVASLSRFPLSNKADPVARLLLVTELARDDLDSLGGTKSHD